MRLNTRFWSLLCGLGLALLSALPAQAEDDGAEEAAALAYARSRLIRNATLSVDPSNPKAGGLDELKRSLAAKAERYEKVNPEAYKLAQRLLGTEDDKSGLIREGARLYRWFASTPAEGEGSEGPQKNRQAYAALRAAAAQWQSQVDAAASYLAESPGPNPWLDPTVLALVQANELDVVETRAWLDERAPKSAEAVRDFKAEQPSRGLVEPSSVAEKAARAKARRAEATAYQQRRAALVASLDRMARSERKLKEDAGTIGFKIDQARGEGAEKGATEPISDELAKYQLDAVVNAQQLRLLYIAARRAELLLQHYAAAENQLKDEAIAAEGAYARFEAELSRQNRESQLERLAAQASELRRGQRRVERFASTGSEGERATWSAYATALEHLTRLNALTKEAVSLRRALEALAKPDCAPGEEGCLPPEVKPDDELPPQEAAAADVIAKNDSLRRFREPEAQALDTNYVRDAQEMLADPAWSADLAARHYVAVDDRIQSLEGALALVRETPALRERFAAAARDAGAALDLVQERAREHRLLARLWAPLRSARGQIEEDTRSFEETLRSIDAERETIREDLVVFRDYRSSLLSLGTRSFQIRVQRTLDADRLGAAFDDVDATVDRAGNWLTFRGDDHAGTFVQRNWALLLACLGVLVASIFFVRYGRHALDGILRSMASRVPALRSEPVTVRAEEAQAKRERAVQEAAAKAAEEEALRQVSKEEADRQQKMGEGGYAGGDDA